MCTTTTNRIGARTAALAFGTTVLLSASAGFGGGTIAEQRARLPPPATCADPVAGTWRSHSWHEGYEEWGIFTLDIARVPGDPNALTGTIHNHSWFGSSAQSEPPPCTGQLDYQVTMTAQGSYLDGAVAFHGTSWTLDQVACGSAFPFNYNLDRFSGTIDPDLQEFQSVNNDLGRYVNVPMVFRRIGCLDEAPATAINIAPPSFYPDDGRSGCSGRR